MFPFKSPRDFAVLFLFILIFTLIAGCSNNLEKRHTLYDNGQLKEEWAVIQDSNENYLSHGIYTAWYENGQKKQKENWEYGKLQGLFITWHENGMKHQAGEYSDGKMSGSYVEWDPNGMKIIEGFMKNGKQDGKWTFLDEKGNIYKQENYLNGELVD